MATARKSSIERFDLGSGKITTGSKGGISRWRALVQHQYPGVDLLFV